MSRDEKDPACAGKPIRFDGPLQLPASSHAMMPVFPSLMWRKSDHTCHPIESRS